jgi:exodeoxyribonuclease V alpha subunit
VVSARPINHGELPALDRPSGTEIAATDFYFIARDDPEAARATIVELFAERIPARFGFDRSPRSRCSRRWAPRRARHHVAQLRAAGSAQSEDGGLPELTRGDRMFRRGDKVMQLRNDDDSSVFNVDIPRGGVSSPRPGYGSVWSR